MWNVSLPERLITFLFEGRQLATHQKALYSQHLLTKDILSYSQIYCCSLIGQIISGSKQQRNLKLIFSKAIRERVDEWRSVDSHYIRVVYGSWCVWWMNHITVVFRVCAGVFQQHLLWLTVLFRHLLPQVYGNKLLIVNISEEFGFAHMTCLI